VSCPRSRFLANDAQRLVKPDLVAGDEWPDILNRWRHAPIRLSAAKSLLFLDPLTLPLQSS